MSTAIDNIPAFYAAKKRRQNHVLLEENMARAALVRERAWDQARRLIAVGRYGDVYRLMVNACKQARRVEMGIE